MATNGTARRTNPKRKKRTGTARMAAFALAMVAALSFLSVVAFRAANLAFSPKEELPAVKDETEPPKPSEGGSPAEKEAVQAKEQEEKAAKVTSFIIGGVSTEGNCTDTMLLATHDGNDNSVRILQIPRDTYVPMDKGTRKINSAYLYGGGENMRKTVSELLGIQVDYYAVINTKAFRQIVDGLGGVSVTVPFDMDYEDPEQDLYIHLKEGHQLLNGQQAEGFVRYRDGYVNADIGRMQAMKEFMKGMMKQATSLKNAFKWPGFIGTVFQNLKTDIGLDDTLKLVGIALKLDMDKITVYSLPGEACHVVAPGTNYKQWLFSGYKAETLALVNEAFNRYGDKLTEEDLGLVELSRLEAAHYKPQSDTLADVDQKGVQYYQKDKKETKWYQSQHKENQ